MNFKVMAHRRGGGISVKLMPVLNIVPERSGI
nr:MAG TPA: hypothetical protein [Caudoviricetes sp.]